MALPWLIGAAVVAAGAAIVKSISDDNEQEERERRERREREESERIARENERKREEALRKQKQEEEARQRKAKHEFIVGRVTSLLDEYDLVDYLDKDLIVELIKQKERKIVTEMLLQTWNNLQELNEIEVWHERRQEMNRLIKQLKG